MRSRRRIDNCRNFFEVRVSRLEVRRSKTGDVGTGFPLNAAGMTARLSSPNDEKIVIHECFSRGSRNNRDFFEVRVSIFEGRSSNIEPRSSSLEHRGLEAICNKLGN